MPRFEPFPGLRYDPSLALDALIAPPYDVVGPAERARLAARHPANAIHVELPVDDPATGNDRYHHAASLLGQWIEQGTLRRDEVPAFYGYRMTTPDGDRVTGVLGALGCEDPGGDVLPHEQTIPKDRSDRLDLIRATRANLSPIWGLSLTTGLAKLYEQTGPAHATATDDDGIGHELWVLDDPGTIETIRDAVAASPVVIADGHHRYEVARTYQAEQRQEHGGDAGGADFVMALVVELAPDQLSVWPIHRLISGVPSSADLVDAFREYFNVVAAGPADESVLAATVQSQALAMVVDDEVWLLTPHDGAYARADSDLDSSVVAMAVQSLAGASISYHHDWRTVVDATKTGAAGAAVLMRPVTVDQIGAWAHARKRMPPKSTFFHPKPRTGMLYRRLDG
ncbi:MAG: DUF1015 family protein [Acidimicrobiales bacterium]